MLGTKRVGNQRKVCFKKKKRPVKDIQIINQAFQKRKEKVGAGKKRRNGRGNYPRSYKKTVSQNRRHELSEQKAGPLSNRHDQRGRNTQRIKNKKVIKHILLLLLSRFSCVRLCVTSQMAAHQAPPSLGFSRQEHQSGLPFLSPMQESESEVTQSCPTPSDPMGCSPPGSSIHEIFQARVLEWGAKAFSFKHILVHCNQKTMEQSIYYESNVKVE